MSDNNVESIILSRIDNIETKVDRMNDAIVAFARNEEKVSNLIAQVNLINQKNSDLEDKLEEFIKKAQSQNLILNIINKGFWIIATAGLTTLVVKYI